MSSIEIQRIQAAIGSVQKEMREFLAKAGEGSVTKADVTQEVQTAYVRMMVSVDTSIAEIKTRMDELEKRIAAAPAPVAAPAVDIADLIARIEKMEAVPKMAKAAEILARLEKLEAGAQSV